jgi:hypothetical protein
MTLIISGYNHYTGFDTEYPKSDSVTESYLGFSITPIHTPTKKSKREIGLFSIADSMITTIGTNEPQPLLKGFRKIVNIPIKLWKPYLIGSTFSGYRSTHQECDCFIAFAGSTLTSQHVINLITHHLGNLRIDYRTKSVGQGDFVVVKDCEYNELSATANCSEYDDDIFIPEKDYINLLTADIITDVVEHSINTALNSAKEFRITESQFNSMHSDFTLGINCPSTGEDFLYQFNMKRRLNSDNVFELFVDRLKIDENQVSVIGMKNKFKNRIDRVVEKAINENLNLCDELTQFMEQAIMEVGEQGSYAIGKPISVKELNRGRLNKTITIT